jgi:hydroxymethylbilane synthase
MKKNLRIATRASLLARAQTEQLIALLRNKNPGVAFEIHAVTTTGDSVTDRPLASFRGTGVFVREIQAALLDGRADMAVHSLKDMPTGRPDGLTVAGFPTRACPYDLCLARNGVDFANLAPGALIGTGSPRRIVQLKAARADVRFADLRGNLDTRIAKLETAAYDAICVAAAGLIRLEKTFPQSAILSADICIPAVGQGALALECRADDDEVKKIAASVNDRRTQIEVECERSFLVALGGGCSMPIAAFAHTRSDTIHIEGIVGDPETARIVRRKISVNTKDHCGAGRKLADAVKAGCDQNAIRIQP